MSRPLTFSAPSWRTTRKGTTAIDLRPWRSSFARWGRVSLTSTDPAKAGSAASVRRAPRASARLRFIAFLLNQPVRRERVSTRVAGCPPEGAACPPAGTARREREEVKAGAGGGGGGALGGGWGALARPGLS